MVRVWTDRLQIIDVNKDCFEIRGVGYPDSAIVRPPSCREHGV